MRLSFLLLAEVFRGIASRNVSRLISFGTNTVQSAAQILRLSDAPVVCTVKNWTKIELQGLAILQINNVNIDLSKSANFNALELNKFAKWYDEVNLMKSKDPFIKEVSCLHGIDSNCRHKASLDIAFDTDEDLSLDMINQVNHSS